MIDHVSKRIWVIPAAAALFFMACGSSSPTLAVGQVSAQASDSSFAVVAGSAVTLTDSAITGDVATGDAFTETRSTYGTLYQADATAAQAYADFLSEYESVASIDCQETLTGTLAGVVLLPGVYCFDAAATLTGVLTLKGPSNGIWIFKVGTSGTGALTGTNFSVVMEGGGEACNVTWWVAQAATMTTSNFQGIILAGADIVVTGVAGSTFAFNGDAWAGGAGSTSEPTGAVTLTGATVTACALGGSGSGGGGEPHKGACNQGVGNGPEDCDPGNSNQGDPGRSNDELGGTPGDPGRQGGNGK